ncbi:MAG: alpha/beta hydrolase [Rhodospirillales bacterium]|nr:alpha/beta hydrolase [Rhodospirillales bacterium]
MSRRYRERYIFAQDGLRLFYRDYGDAGSARTPVLCLTGLTRNSADFADLAERLSGDRRVLCPDYRGRGRSAYDPNWRNYDPMVYLADIGQLLAATDIGRVVVVGSSLGGILAMGLAVLRPTLIAAAVINDIGPDVEPDGLGRIIAFIERDRPQPDWPTAVRMLQHALSGLAAKDAPWWERFTRATYRQGADGLLHFDWDIAIVEKLRRSNGAIQDLWPVFGALRDVPTLLVRGALSDILTEDGLHRMVQAKPDLLTVTVPDVGHVPSLDEPAVQEILDGFIARF